MTGLALPTAAAAALSFTATGAAVVTSTNSQAATLSSKAMALQASSAATSDHDQLRARRTKATEDNALVIARADAARVARSAERKELAARTLKAKLKEKAHSWQLPIKKYVLTSGFKMRWGRQHAGEDFGIPVGTKLGSMSTGTVIFAGVQGGYGNLVKIRYWDGTTSFYAHMSSISVTAGEGVDPGQVVGLSGNTGHSTGPHLHLEIHPDGGAAIDPLPWLAAHNIAA